MSIDAILRPDHWRDGPVPEFLSEDIPSKECRWGRRRFNPTKTGGLVLPWIAMNPAGNEQGTGETGKRVFAWSWHWGFDECVVYNVRPFQDPNSDIAQRRFAGRDGEIEESHVFIAEQLRQADAVVVAWGNEHAEQKGWARQLLASINAGRQVPIATWCLATNGSGHPKHPGRRAQVSPSKQAEEWVSIFDIDQPSKRLLKGNQRIQKVKLKIPLSEKSKMLNVDLTPRQSLRKDAALSGGMDIPEAFNPSDANRIVRQRMLSIAASSGLNFHSGEKQARLDGAPEFLNVTRLFRHEFTSRKADILVREDVFPFDAGLRDAGKWRPHKKKKVFQNLLTDDLELLGRILDAVEAFAANRVP